MPKSTIPFQLCAALAFFVALLHSAVANDPSHPLAAHWEYLATSKDNQPVTFKLRLAGEHFDELSSKMLHIATTRSSWLNSEQLQHYVTPSRQDQTAVQEFLDKHGVASDQVHVNRFKNAWTIKSDAALVSKMLNTTLEMYRHKDTGVIVYSATHATLPSSVPATVQGLTPSSESPRRSSSKQTAGFLEEPNMTALLANDSATPSGCELRNVTRSCISQIYALDSYKPSPNSESAAVLALGAWSDKTLLDYERNLYPAAHGYIPNKLYLGPDTGEWANVTKDNTEAIFDIQALIGLAYPLNLTAFIKRNTHKTDYLTNAMQDLIELPDAERPGVLSISYGVQEEKWPEADSRATCQAVQQLAALGTTVLVAPGDNGVEINNDDKGNCPPFRADFLSACPYVVSVGATMDFDPERAAYYPQQPDIANGWSSGGFSNRFAPLDYQKSALKTYLATLDPKLSDHFNASGRGFTDVSALGGFISAWFSTGPSTFSGTSASTPIFAAIMALVNSKCKSKGKPRIGWAHPTLYSHPQAFKDITKGGEYHCGETQLGFPCKTGWDPATGLGSPNFPRLVEAFGC